MSDGDLIEAEPGADPVAQADTDAAAQPDIQAAPVPAPDWSNSPEFSQAVQNETMRALEQLAAQQQPAQPGEAPELDPFDPDSIRNAIRSEAELIVNERFGPMQPAIEHAQQQWAQQYVNQTLDQLGVTDPAVRDQVVYATPGFLPMAGNPQQAMQQAYQWVQQQNTQIRERAIEEYKQSLTVTPPGAPGTAGTAGLSIEEAPKSYEDVVKKYVGMTAA